MADEKKETKPVKKVKAVKERHACKVKGCKRPYRAKGYCNAHFHKWRRGELKKARYQTCQHGVKKLKRGEKKECLKKVFRSGLCEEHYKVSLVKKAGAAEAPPPAAAPAAPAATA